MKSRNLFSVKRIGIAIMMILD